MARKTDANDNVDDKEGSPIVTELPLLSGACTVNTKRNKIEWSDFAMNPVLIEKVVSYSTAMKQLPTFLQILVTKKDAHTHLSETFNFVQLLGKGSNLSVCLLCLVNDFPPLSPFSLDGETRVDFF